MNKRIGRAFNVLTTPQRGAGLMGFDDLVREFSSGSNGRDPVADVRNGLSISVLHEAEAQIFSVHVAPAAHGKPAMLTIEPLPDYQEQFRERPL